jgi:hypothetical protein
MADRYPIPTDDGERVKHKAYVVMWEHEPRNVITSFDTLTEATEAIRSLRLDRRHIVFHAGKVVWPESLRDR